MKTIKDNLENALRCLPPQKLMDLWNRFEKTKVYFNDIDKVYKDLTHSELLEKFGSGEWSEAHTYIAEFNYGVESFDNLNFVIDLDVLADDIYENADETEFMTLLIEYEFGK